MVKLLQMFIKCTNVALAHNGDVDGMKIQFARRMVEYFKNF